MLRERFLADGIPATVWEPVPGRGVVAARLRGIGKHTKAIVLLSHMDVVPANAKQWQVPPFSGEVKDGEPCIVARDGDKLFFKQKTPPTAASSGVTP